MAFLNIKNVRIRGISLCVPKEIEKIEDAKCFSEGEAKNISAVTGIIEHRISSSDKIASDYGIVAAKRLLEDLEWLPQSIDVLIFVPLARDYNEPNTANLIQHRLGISTDCIALDQPMACSGYIYALSTACSYLSSGQVKRALVFAGDTQSKMISSFDKTLWPINGDAMTVTALEYDESADPIYFNLNSDGAGYEALIAPASGFREQPSIASFKLNKIGDGILRNRTQVAMDGMSVFQFAITKPFKSIKMLAEKFNLNIETIDFLILHQANKMIDEKIRKKLNLPEAKVPYSLDYYGNSSSGTIPVTMVSRIASPLRQKKQKLILCGFGAGLSWGSVYLHTENLIIPEIIEI